MMDGKTTLTRPMKEQSDGLSLVLAKSKTKSSKE